MTPLRHWLGPIIPVQPLRCEWWGHCLLTVLAIDRPALPRWTWSRPIRREPGVADELSLLGAVLEGPGSSQLGRLLEGMMMAQVSSVLARLGVPDQLAGGPATADQLAPRVGAAADA